MRFSWRFWTVLFILTWNIITSTLWLTYSFFFVWYYDDSRSLSFYASYWFVELRVFSRGSGWMWFASFSIKIFRLVSYNMSIWCASIGLNSYTDFWSNVMLLSKIFIEAFAYSNKTLNLAVWRRVKRVVLCEIFQDLIKVENASEVNWVPLCDTSVLELSKQAMIFCTAVIVLVVLAQVMLYWANLKKCKLISQYFSM